MPPIRTKRLTTPGSPFPGYQRSGRRRAYGHVDTAKPGDAAGRDAAAIEHVQASGLAGGIGAARLHRALLRSRRMVRLDGLANYRRVGDEHARGRVHRVLRALPRGDDAEGSV